MPVSPWWGEAVVYQVYVKSFADSNGDGIGDLDGVTARLDHLVDLGVDGLWLNPCYPSPDRDGGYDVADYVSVAEVYGGTTALVRLLGAAHDRNLRVLLDLVPNHCSIEHEWFQAALAEPRCGAHRKRFFFRDGCGVGGAEPPNNWQSTFGGPAWTRVREQTGEWGQWYLHLFDSGQPDFDWRNSEVRAYFEHVMRYWFDQGIDGFRIDVAHGLLKAATLPDFDPGSDEASPMTNQAEVHDVYRSWRSITDGYRPDRELVFVGEAWASTVDDMAAYVRHDELHQTFYFNLLEQPWNAACFRASVQNGLDALKEIGDPSETGAGRFAWTLSNHDVCRSVSRYGLVDRPTKLPYRSTKNSADEHAAAVRPRGNVDVSLGQARSRAAALFILGLPGPVYLYQGEELGLPEVTELPDDRRQDPIWNCSNGTDPGRDGCRVPLPWTTKEPTYGFSLGEGGAPAWLPQPPVFEALAVSAQATDEDSSLAMYRDALRLRRELILGAPSTVEWLDVHGRDDVIAYRRGGVVVVTNFGSEAVSLPPAWGEVLLASDRSTGPALPGSSAAWLAAR